MSSILISRRLRHPDPTERPVTRPIDPAPARARGSLAPVPRKSRRSEQATPARFVIALVPRGKAAGEKKRYLARRNGRTYFVPQAREAMTYATYRTAHMIGIKAAVHYGCVACVEEI